MQRYFIKLSFKGTNYHGWQCQKNQISVQETINLVLSRKLNEKINVTGAGRTDTGVHANIFYAHFNSKNNNLNKDNGILNSVNNYLPSDIAVHLILKVKDNANARFDAISRTYKYYISPEKKPFNTDYYYYFKQRLDAELMNRASDILINTKDYTSFCKLHSDNKSNICKVEHAAWSKSEGFLVFEIRADRFLRNMVRAIVGTIIDVGRKKISIEQFKKIIESKNRSNAGYSVPAKGLFLDNIQYPKSVFELNKA